MPRWLTISLLTSLTLIAKADNWSHLPPLPDKLGFAGSFAGVSNGALLVAGGANFPDKKPWEGGAKVWTDAVYVLDRPDANWRLAGHLPHPLGYGVGVTYHDAVICAGGSDAKRHYADVFRLDYRDGKLTTTPLPPLPKTIANACGAIVGDTLYVAGGLESPDAKETLNTVYTIDLAQSPPRWAELYSWPGGGRMLAVAASSGGMFWVIGGADLVVGPDGKTTRRYLKNVYNYGFKSRWQRAADLPWAVVAAPSPAPADISADSSGPYILGGDDGSQLTASPADHHGFERHILHYQTSTGKWLETGLIPADTPAPVTTPCVKWQDRWVIPGGEIRPAIRTPQVSAFTPEKRE